MTQPANADLHEVNPSHRFDEQALKRYLEQHIEGFSGALTVKQFASGQSNPTFQLQTAITQFVLRKKPPGNLLPSAHAIEREYRVMSALRKTQVQVPRMLSLCTDQSIIGTEFYVMEMIDGRIFHDPGLPGLSPAERNRFYDSFARSLAQLHSVTPDTIGLSDFGRPDGFINRQVKRWSQQYLSTETEHIEAMHRLIAWLPDNLPQDQETAIVHGDYRPGNVIVGKDTCEISAILDWELCTLGHPLADVGYVCALYHADVLPTGRLKGLDYQLLGIPTEQEFIDLYCQYSNRTGIDNHLFFVVFSLFRSAAIIQGVYKRGLDGNASSESALQFGKFARYRAETAWDIVETQL